MQKDDKNNGDAASSFGTKMLQNPDLVARFEQQHWAMLSSQRRSHVPWKIAVLPTTNDPVDNTHIIKDKDDKKQPPPPTDDGCLQHQTTTTNNNEQPSLPNYLEIRRVQNEQFAQDQLQRGLALLRGASTGQQQPRDSTAAAAEECYQRGLEVMPHHVDLLVAYACLCANRKLYAQAITMLDQAIQIDPTHANALQYKEQIQNHTLRAVDHAAAGGGGGERVDGDEHMTGDDAGLKDTSTGLDDGVGQDGRVRRQPSITNQQHDRDQYPMLSSSLDDSSSEENSQDRRRRRKRHKKERRREKKKRRKKEQKRERKSSHRKHRRRRRHSEEDWEEDDKGKASADDSARNHSKDTFTKENDSDDSNGHSPEVHDTTVAHDKDGIPATSPAGSSILLHDDVGRARCETQSRNVQE